MYKLFILFTLIFISTSSVADVFSGDAYKEGGSVYVKLNSWSVTYNECEWFDRMCDYGFVMKEQGKVLQNLYGKWYISGRPSNSRAQQAYPSYGVYRNIGYAPSGVDAVCVGGRFAPLGIVYMALSGNSCFSLGDPPLTCELKGGDILLGHGVLSSSDVNGSLVKKYVNIACSGKANVTFSFDGNDGDIHLFEGVFSRVKVNDRNLPATLNVNGTENISVSSELHSGNGVLAGDFSGSAVMRVSFN
ncbi:hypothetical protein ACTWOG_004798 [Serratia marcescens]